MAGVDSSADSVERDGDLADRIGNMGVANSAQMMSPLTKHESQPTK